MHRRPRTVKVQHLARGELHNRQGVIGVLVLDKLGVSDVLADSKHPVNLFLRVLEVLRLTRFEKPPRDVDVVDACCQLSSSAKHDNRQDIPQSIQMPPENLEYATKKPAVSPSGMPRRSGDGSPDGSY
jgi:hypothetical protein